MGVVAVQRLGNLRPNALRIAKHLVVPEANDPITFRFNQPRAAGIPLRTMLPAINFDDQPCSVTGKVSREHSERHLKAEACVREALAKKPQHCALGLGCIGPKRPGASGRAV